MREYSLADLMTIQNDLNKVIDRDWLRKRTKEDFFVAIVDELAEYLGSGVDFKFWKYTDPSKYDRGNAVLEIVDITHFYLSLLIMDHAKKFPKSPEDFSYLESTFIQHREDWVFGSLIEGKNDLNHEAFMILTRNLLDPIVSRSVVSYLIQASNMTPEEFSAIYAAKSALNEIRSLGGYKDGTYKKVQDGIEDNERLKSIVEDFLNDPERQLHDIKGMVFNKFFENG